MHRHSLRLTIVSLGMIAVLLGAGSPAWATTDKQKDDADDSIWWETFFGLLTPSQELVLYDLNDRDHRAQRRAAAQTINADVAINGHNIFVGDLGTNPFQLSLLFTSNATDDGPVLPNQTPLDALVSSVSYYYAPFPTGPATGVHWTDNPAAGTFVGGSSNPLNGFAVTTSLPAQAINQPSLYGPGTAEARYYALITYLAPQPGISYSSVSANMESVPEPASIVLFALAALVLATGRGAGRQSSEPRR